MKKLLSMIVAFVLCAALVGCGISSNTPSADPQTSAAKQHEVDRQSYKVTLHVYNYAEYIDESAIVDFEKEYKIRVEYDEFESNESMYDVISKSPNSYDVVVASDYMVDRLIKEGKVAKLDKTVVTNIDKVDVEYLSPTYDPQNDYAVPYMVGTVGILYNKRKVAEPIDSWTALFSSQYKGKVLLWDSERDVIGMALKMLGYSMNSKDDKELAAAQEKLLSVRSSVQYGEEDVRDKIIAGEGVMALVYSGDAKLAVDQNSNLAYCIPKEGSNKWVDNLLVLKTTKVKDAAEKFINFMCRPNIAIRNMTTIGYTSPIKGAWAEFNNNKIMFPSAEELARCEAFLYDVAANKKYDTMWAKVR